MDTRYVSFSDQQDFHASLIVKGIGKLSVEDFMKPYAGLYSRFQAVNVEQGWQICQYEGRACIGIFRVYDYPDEETLKSGVCNFVAGYWHAAFVALDIGRVTDVATEWFHKNRHRGYSAFKPSIHVSPERAVYPVSRPTGEF